MRLPIAAFYPAHSSNFTPGRYAALRKFTVHHSAGWEATLRHLWADPARNGSSTFWVGNVLGAVEQYVDTNDTPWTNGSSASNAESLTCETRGDWRGYYNETTLKNLENLMFDCLKIWPHLVLEYHMDVVDKRYYPGGTQCPAELKTKGHAVAAWNRAKARLNTPAPAPATPLKFEAIAPKRVELTRLANLWDFNFSDWSQAKPVNPPEFANGYPAGYTVDVVAIATNSLGAKYYMTAYSYNGGSVRANKGFNTKDCKDYVTAPIPQPQPGPAPAVQPPAVVPNWEPLATPRKLESAIDLYVIDLDTKKNVGAMINAGQPISFVEKINLDKVYFRSEWAKTNGKNWGIPFDQLKEIKAPVNEPIPEKPIDTDPKTPGNGDTVEVRLSLIEKFLEFIFPGWKNRK